MAATGSTAGGGKVKKEDLDRIARQMAQFNDPIVAAKYAADPRVQVANSLADTAGNTGPVAGGKWGIPDGLTRVGAGLAQGFLEKRAKDKYSKDSETASGVNLDALAKTLANNPQTEASLGEAVQGAAPAFAPAQAAPPPPPPPPPDAMAGGGGPQMPPPAPPGGPQGVDPTAAVAQALAPPGGPQMPPPGGPPPMPGGPPPNAMPQGQPPANPIMASASPMDGRGAVQSVSRQTIADMANWARARGATVTSIARSPAKNAKVGGVGNSYHLSGRAFDSVPPQGFSMNAWEQELKAKYPNMDVINEKDHIHVEPASRDQVAPDGSIAVPASGGEAVAAQGGAAGPYAIPELPPEPERFTRPKEREHIKALRLEMARNLLSGRGTNGLSNDQLRGMIGNLDPSLGEAFDQQFDSDKEAFQAESNLDYADYTAGRQGEETRRNERYRGQIDERGDYIQGNIDYGKQAQDNANRLSQLAAQHGYEMSEIGARNAGEMAVAGLKAGGGPSGKPLMGRIEKDITDMGSMLDTQRRLVSTFKPEYAGALSGTTAVAGDWISNKRAIVGGDKAGQDRIAFWKDYQTWVNSARHGEFGSALTEREKIDFDAANIDRTTAPDVADRRLKQQLGIISRAAVRKARGSAAAGYNSDQILELIGPENYDFASTYKGDQPEPVNKDAQNALTPRASRPPGTPRKPQAVVPYKNSQAYKNAQGQWVMP